MKEKKRRKKERRMSRTSTYPCASCVIRVYSCLARSYAKCIKERDREIERASERASEVYMLYVCIYTYICIYVYICMYIYI